METLSSSSSSSSISANTDPSVRSSYQQLDPISILAILFHDVIYYSLDQKLSEKQWTLLQGVIEEKAITTAAATTAEEEGPCRHEITLLPFSKHQDPLVRMVQNVFDMPEQPKILPSRGMNEFLSALIATRALQKYFLIQPPQQLVQLAMAIEATIPFRKTNHDASGKESSPMDHLYDRAFKAYTALLVDTLSITHQHHHHHYHENYHNNMDDSCDKHVVLFVTDAVHQAVMVGNSDLGAFSNPDPTTFIDSNWKLLPEWFPILQQLQQEQAQCCCSLAKFQQILVSVRQQQRKLDPANIFVSFRGRPDSYTMNSKSQRATANLIFLNMYMEIRILTMFLLHDLWFLYFERHDTDNDDTDNDDTDNDGVDDDGTAVQLQLVDLRRIEQAVKPKTMLLINVRKQWKEDSQDALLYRVLVEGRSADYQWDPKQSTIGAALLVELGSTTEVSRRLEHRQSSDTENDENAAKNVILAWIKSLPRRVVEAAREGLQEATKISPTTTNLYQST